MLESRIDEIIVFLQKKKEGLGHLAFKDENSRGRRSPKDSDSWMCGLASPFVVDQQKIERSKAWRRLALKTQVFSLSLNSNLRTRLTHTHEVVATAAFIAKVLGLNVELCVSIAKAHDIGHVPFGHVGERFFEKKTGKKFDHASYGAVVLQEIERGGGLNASFEVLEGMTYHSGKPIPREAPQEYRVVYWADKHYLLHDIKDAQRKGLLRLLPEPINSLGDSHRARTRSLILALLDESVTLGRVSFEFSAEARALSFIKEWMFENVYRRIDDGPCLGVLDAVYNFLEKETRKEGSIFRGLNPATLLSLMTDGECWMIYQSLISNSSIDIAELGVAEIAGTLPADDLTREEPDFSWAEKNKE